MSAAYPPARLYLMGRTELVAPDGSAVNLTAKKVWVLLAVLAMNEGGAISRLELAQKVWPESPPNAARDSLRTALTTLRRSLLSGAVETTRDSVRLRPDSIECDALAVADGGTYAGDFMPMVDHDWVVEQRLRLRAIAVRHLMISAEKRWTHGDREEALKLAEQACQIDPHCEDAAQLRVRLLDKGGDRSRAVQVSDAFRARALRDLGVVADVRPPTPATIAHPLFAAAEWLIDRHPAEAMALLASTHSQWLSLPVEPGLSIHERALLASPGNTSARRIVQAQRMNLLVLAGRLGPMLEEAQRIYTEDLHVGEPLVAARLAGAISYGFLSKGDFAKSVAFADRALHAANQVGDKDTEVEFLSHCGIVRQQAGHGRLAETFFARARKGAERCDSMLTVASIGLQTADHCMRLGKADQAAGRLENARRLFESGNYTRMIPWVLHSEAKLFQLIGDHSRALAKLDEIRKIGAEVGGHSVTAMTQEEMARVNCELGELDVAAESLATATLYRRSLGTVASPYERTNVSQAKRILKERLDRRDLQAAFRRAEQAQATAHS